MSRAFVKEDADGPQRRYHLPKRDDPGFDAAAAWALLEGANVGDSLSAQEATGYRWGEPALTNSATMTVSYTAADNAGGSGLAKVDLYAKAPGQSAYGKVASDTWATVSSAAGKDTSGSNPRMRLVAATSSAPSAEPCASPVFCLVGAGQAMMVCSLMKVGLSVTCLPRSMASSSASTSSV